MGVKCYRRCRGGSVRALALAEDPSSVPSTLVCIVCMYMGI